MNNKKPLPLVSCPQPKTCPVCGHSSYSSNGIHPQCAVTQADEPRKARLVAAKKAIAQEKKTSHESKPSEFARNPKSFDPLRYGKS